MLLPRGLTTGGQLDLINSCSNIRDISFRPEEHKYIVYRGLDTIIEPPSVTQILNAVFGNDLGKIKPEVLAKAKEKGKLVHQELYHYKKTGVPGMSLEFQAAKKELDESAMGGWVGEQLLFGEIPDTPYNCCGTLDSYSFSWSGEEGKITDYKITYSLNVKSVTRQLNIYAYMVRKMGWPVTKLEAWHIKGSKLRKVNIPIKSDEYVENILRSYYDGLTFKNDTEMMKHFKGESKPEESNDIEEILIKIDRISDLINGLKERKELYLAELMRKMNNSNLEYYKFENMDIHLIPYSERYVFDSKRFQAEQPTLYKQYLKKSLVKPHISIKKEK